MPEAGSEQHAAIGELRLYSTNAIGEQKIYLWLKNDGTMELGGSTRNAVKYQELEDGFNQLRSDLNSLIADYNIHTHVCAAPTFPSAIPVPLGTPSTADISAAKSNNVKL